MLPPGHAALAASRHALPRGGPIVAVGGKAPGIPAMHPGFHSVHPGHAAVARGLAGRGGRRGHGDACEEEPDEHQGERATYSTHSIPPSVHAT
jgi:hypothetical protein